MFIWVCNYLPVNNTNAEVHRTLCAHDHNESDFSVSLEYRG